MSGPSQVLNRGSFLGEGKPLILLPLPSCQPGLGFQSWDRVMGHQGRSQQRAFPPLSSSAASSTVTTRPGTGEEQGTQAGERGPEGQVGPGGDMAILRPGQCRIYWLLPVCGAVGLGPRGAGVRDGGVEGPLRGPHVGEGRVEARGLARVAIIGS